MVQAGTVCGRQHQVIKMLIFLAQNNESVREIHKQVQMYTTYPLLHLTFTAIIMHTGLAGVFQMKDTNAESQEELLEMMPMTWIYIPTCT